MQRTYLYNLIMMGLIMTAQLAFGQLDAPNVAAVYGGRINAITGIPLNADTSRIFIATESANSLFYADIYTHSAVPTYGNFSVFPGVDANAGYGSSIQQIAAHTASGQVYFIHNNNDLMLADPTSTAVTTIYTGFGVNTLEIFGDRLFFTEGNQLHFGNLNTSGTVTWDSASPLSFSAPGGLLSLHVNPLDSTLYIFTAGSVPTIVKTSDSYLALSASTTFSSIGTTGLSTSLSWVAFGIAPSGRLFTVASDMFDKTIAYSDDETFWTSFASGQGGVAGSDFAFSGDSSTYTVYHAKMYNPANGVAGSWHTFGNPGGLETHPNDGSVFTDPVNANLVYMTTDQGIGVSEDRGATIFEIDAGVEAVQVNDFDQTASKMTGWLASKSGVRRVDDYLTGALWTNAIFPNGDGSPYYSTAIDPSDTNTVYVGNVRIYQTQDAGTNWSQLFTPENAPYNFSNVGTKCLALEVCDYDSSVVFAGFEVQGNAKGGVFYSNDRGATWDQLLLESSSVGQDVDVSDIVFTLEGADTVAYFSALYDLSVPQGYSVYRAVKSGPSWSVAQDMGPTGTSTGAVIVVTLWDLELSTTQDTLYAVGTDAGTNHPTAYYKPLNGTALWTVMSTSGFPTEPGAEATAVTIGLDTVYVAVANNIYCYDLAGSSWTPGYSYPVGTRINMLFYDELLVGTDLGFFGHNAAPLVAIDEQNIQAPGSLTLAQNYPNPFNPTTCIAYTMAGPGYARLGVYNVLGAKIALLTNQYQAAGSYSVSWDGRDTQGIVVAAGLYFYRLQVADQILTQKMMLLK